MWVVRYLSGNKWFLLALVIAAWAGIEAGGKGTGVLQWLFLPSATRDGGFHPVDVVAPRPKGPCKRRRQNPSVKRPIRSVAPE